MAVQRARTRAARLIFFGQLDACNFDDSREYSASRHVPPMLTGTVSRDVPTVRAPARSPVSRKLYRRGASTAWDAYLNAVYGESTLSYPVDLRRFNWLYWSAPLEAPIWIYSQPVAGADAFVSHYAPLGFSLVRGRKQKPAELRENEHWMEVMREDKSTVWHERAETGFWYYEARGSGIWTALGRHVDYSCTEPLASQAVPVAEQQRYAEACRRHGLAVMRTDWHTLRLDGEHNATQGTRLPRSSFAQYTNSEHKYGIDHRRHHALDSVVRWFGYDLENGLGPSARRELINIRQNDSACGGARFCHGKRCCACVGGSTLEHYTRNGWVARGGPCGCSERFRLPRRAMGKYPFEGFLNCGSSGHPKLRMLLGTTLGGASPFDEEADLAIEVEASCQGELRQFTVPNLQHLAGKGGDFERARRARNCDWTRFKWPPARVLRERVAVFLAAVPGAVT